MIIVNFIGNEVEKYIRGLDQYDRGQILCISGLDLPKFVEVQFSLQETGGLAERIVGITTDGVTEVEIPNYMLTNNDATSDYEIYAFVYVTNETSAETVYKITMEVNSRPKPNPYDTPEDIGMFNRVIEVMKDSVVAAENAAGTAEKNAQKTGEDRKAIEEMVGTITGIEQQVQDVKEYAGQAKTAAENALFSEQEAKKSEEASLQHRTGAETAENNAELAEQNAKKSEQAVEQAKQLVMQMGQEVLQNKNQVDGKVEAFNKTVKDASDAIETAKTDAVDAVETAGTEQAKKITDEGAKQVKAVEDKGNEVLQSIPEDFTTQMQSKLDKNQGTEHAGKALVVGEDGNVTVGEVQGGDGIPIINTMSGESLLVVPDSAERVNKGFSLIGKSEQLTTTGKNLFDVTKVMDLKRYEPSSYGYIGFPINVEPGKTYTFNRNKKNGYGLGTKYNCGLKTDINGTIDNWLINNENEVLNFEKKTIVAKTDKIYFCILETVTDEELSTIIKTCFLNPQLELGNIETTYEPCTGGKASPSPEYPQEIKNVGKWNEEKQKYEVNIKVTNAKESWDKEQTITLTSDRPITKWDKLVEQDGQIGWLYGSKIYVVTGNEVFESRDGYNIESYTNRFFILNDLLMGNDALKPLAYMKCLRRKQYVYAPNIFEEGFETNRNQFHIKFLNERVGISTSDDNAVRTLKYSEYVKKMYKDGNPIEILYATTDTVFLPLPQSKQDAIRALITYYPTTIITVDGGEVALTVELTYTADTKNFILNREKAMQAQMLNIQSALISQKISGGGYKGN